jgi:predicted Zn-dependent peptidase
MAAGNVSENEIARTQGQLVGSMILGLESTDSWMSHVARNEIYFGQAISIDEICQKIRAVSRDEVIELADTLFAKGAMTLTLLGDFNDKFQIKNINLPA